MKDFNKYLSQTEEIGYVEQVADAIVYVSGLPRIKPEEIVIFETGDFGQVFGIEKEIVEILVFSKNLIKPGIKVTRTNEILKVPVGFELLGKVIDPLGSTISAIKTEVPKNIMPINVRPEGIVKRRSVTKTLETGVLIVDLAIPLGHGQRELVVGDRKTGKTSFLTKTILSQTAKGNICIYAAVGKKKLDVKRIEELFRKHGALDKMVIIASGSEDSTGLTYLTPYTAMTVGEFFRNEGKDVLVVLDDLSTHAKFYREIALLGKRFPGRNSYPSDIFYAHARLLERAGNFVTDKGGEASITCLAVAETAQGDLSGYIETNLMSMTDGHLYFDKDLFYLGRRPAINPFLSVTRVGRQTQSNLRREISREIMSFLTLYEKMQSFVHFGAELNENIKMTLSTGAKIIQFFNQYTSDVIPLNLQVVLFCMLWANLWGVAGLATIKQDMEKIIEVYNSNRQIRDKIDSLVKIDSFNELLGKIKVEGPKLLQAIKSYEN